MMLQNTDDIARFIMGQRLPKKLNMLASFPLKPEENSYTQQPRPSSRRNISALPAFLSFI